MNIQKKPEILMIIDDDTYSLIFSHVSEKLNENFNIVKFNNEKFGNKIDYDHIPDIKNIQGYVGSWGSPVFNKEILEHMPRLEIIALAKGSVKNYVCPEIVKRGIKITSAHMALAPSVAETTLMLTLMGLKSYKKQRLRLEKGLKRTPEPIGYELKGKKVGLVGYGRIARCFKKLLAGFDVKIMVYDPYLVSEDIESEDIRMVSLEKLLSQSDILSLHAPGTEGNTSLIDHEALAKIKNECLIVNTARGNLINEDALYEELKTGRIRAALDVFREEPLPLDSPLRELENVVLTPHIGGYTFDSREKAGELVFNELMRYFNDKELKYEADLEQLEHRA